MNDVRVGAIADRDRCEQRRRQTPRHPGQEALEPVAEGVGVEHATHELGLDQRRREEIEAGRLPRRRGVAIVAEPGARLRLDRGRERGFAGVARVVEREEQAERAVGVHPVADRVVGLRQPREIAVDERARERRELARPATRVGIAASARARRASFRSHVQP